MKKGPWTGAEDAILIDYVKKNGEGNWNAVQKNSGLQRCGKSCRLRWANHLRPNLKKGAFTAEEEGLILELHAKYGNKWARMASQMPGRTDNEIKNYWNTRLKRHQRAGLPIYPSDIKSGEVHYLESSHRLQPRQRKQHSHHHLQPKVVLDFQNQRTISAAFINPITISQQPQPFLFNNNNNIAISSQRQQKNNNNNADQEITQARPLFDDQILPVQLNSTKQDHREFGFVHLLSSSASGMLDDVLNAVHFRSMKECDNNDILSQPLKKKKLKNAHIASGGDEENSSSGLTSVGGMRSVEEPNLVEINPLDDELTSLLESFPSASPTPQWYRRSGTDIIINDSSSTDARGGVQSMGGGGSSTSMSLWQYQSDLSTHSNDHTG